ncbi:hypothetical protein KBJ94_28000 [Pseudomonas sp. ITA]|uniref:Tc toxin subunit A-related protein n=1 Tax=Pseudomonas sp. ITA TaxID=2825841 RepID=UPI00249913DE|nr:neuraminidase-like domain-containing protein [Pseudomonas sp. ITA]MDI2145892.1 hypothetical protein [Pseudomonas sp. ITA]
MTHSTAFNNIQSARRSALVDYYTTYCVPQTPLADGTALDRHVRTADELYEYLLLDTQIGPEVMTSRVAEAISSLQLYINRCLEGLDPDVNNAAGSSMVEESKPGGFLYEWPDYNQVFSTWAGKERLQYYPSTYLSPELRYNKTELFKALEESINQGQISDDRVESAFQQYMLGFETLATLWTISGYQLGGDFSVNTKDTFYFIGRTPNAPYSYYWRSCNMAVRDDQGALTSGAWSQWLKIDAPTQEAYGGMIRPCWYNNRLYIAWISQQNSGATGTSNVQAQYSYYSNIWYLREDGVWVSYNKTNFSDATTNFLLTAPPVGTVGSGPSVSYDNKYRIPDEFVYSDSLVDTQKNIFLISQGALYLVNYSGSITSQNNTLDQNNVKATCATYSYAAQGLVSTLQSAGIKGLLSYSSQSFGGEPADFNGAYGLYFWEIFFHSVFLIAERYLAEQNYIRAEQWYRYIFSPAGYRTNGGLDRVDGKIRYWNVLPLQTDQAWHTSVPETVDPDVIAMNDPMHYKVAIFLHYVNALIEHGDNCYRMQQRDFLGQAKMYYIQASQLLGPRPEINHTTNWPNPTVGDEVRAITQPASVDLNSPVVLAQLYQAHVLDGNGDFLPPYNDALLTYWDKLEVRLYNLRNNLTLDGQPLVVPLYATPVSPTALQQQHSAGNGTAGVSLPDNQLACEYRFPVLMDKARMAVSGVIQFGSALQSALQQRDNEYMTLLVQTQQQQISALTQDLQDNNIAALNAGITATTQALASAQTRLDHYTGLYNNWISPGEEAAMDLRVVAGALNVASAIPNAIGASVEMAPNIFGLADGGSRWGGVARAVAFGLQASAVALDTAAQRLDVSEQYRRRRSEWQLQKETADFEVKQLTSQIQSQNQQLAMAQKQKALYAQELSNWRAQYAMQTTRFTGLELFNWMASRLSSLYYQMYDSALALCLTAKSALGREIGAGNTNTLFTTPMWNDLYQGLLAGESLQLELQKMENTFLRQDQRGLEIQKTVSLNTQITRADSSHGFLALLNGALQGTPLPATGGVTVQMFNTDKLVISLAIDSLGLNGAYGSTGKVGRFKNISVTLPALLGPYQDVEATLSLGTEVVALSRGLDDSGMFMVDFNDPKYLPFEGDSTSTGTLVLTFFNAGTNQTQRALVESLVDVIFQLRYTLKGY